MKEILRTESVLVEKIIPGGMALGTLGDGKKIFFWNALPKETVTEFKITKNKKSYSEAIALKIENPSSHRIEPKDARFLSTSPWQIMDYNYELETKTALIKELLREHDISWGSEIPILTDGRDFHYRNKMEYSLFFDHEDEKIHLAFHARGSHQKIQIEKSSIERPEIFQKACEIIDDLNSRHEEARKYQSLLLRSNQNGEVSGGLYENGQPHPVFPALKDEILGHTYSYSPNGFFQINLPVYELALEEIKKHIITDEVLDLYAGVGTIGLSVARDKKLTLVECDKFAFQELKNNVAEFSETSTANNKASDPSQENIIAPNAVLAKSEEALDYIKPNQTVILDPPRAGLDVKLTEKLIEITPETIIYLSCNPSTQMRDVKILENRYKITLIKAFNFFPRTPHIENLVVLTRK